MYNTISCEHSPKKLIIDLIFMNSMNFLGQIEIGQLSISTLDVIHQAIPRSIELATTLENNTAVENEQTTQQLLD